MGSSLMRMLLADDIVPGSEPSYQLCKEIYLYHPLGAKLAEAPINLAQSQVREIEVEGHSPRVKRAFEDEWLAMKTDRIIHNLAKTARIYGIAQWINDGRFCDAPSEPGRSWCPEHSARVFVQP
jgi:hypothetical protein